MGPLPPRSPIARALALFALMIGAGCSDGTSAAPAADDGAIDDGLGDACNPLRSAGACLLPFPSSAFLADDAASPTGVRVALSAEVMPRNNLGVAYDPARMNLADGFSPSAEILAYLPERLDPASLVPEGDPARSLDPSSATVIVDMESGERVAHLSEPDAQVFKDEDRQTVILRPMTRLAPARRYAVAITRHARTLAGAVPASPPSFAAIVAGKVKSARGAAQTARMPAVFEALAGAGVAQGDVLLAWDFVTASDASLTRSLQSMRDQTLATIGAGGLGFTIDSVEDDFNSRTLRRIRGTFTVPRFLTSTDVAVADATLTLDADGLPVASGTYEAPFTIVLPRAAENQQVRLLLFGHGFLGSGEGELGNESGSYVQDFADEKGYAIVATDWIGLSRYEGLDSSGSAAASQAVQDINRVPWITDRLAQAMVNVVTLARTSLAAIARDPALFVGGQPVIDATRIDYFGISLGGVLGASAVHFSPDLQRGVLNVGASGWSSLFQRSQNWSLFKLFVDGSYPDKLDQQILLEVMQAHFDPIDGMSVAPTLLASPKEGPQKQLLMQIAVRDAQVPNLASEIAARSMGLALLDDAPLDVFGMTPAAGPLPSALTAWDTGEAPLPAGNISASVASDNDAHTSLRALPAVVDQIDHFFRQGEVVSTCEGPCDPE